MWNLEGIARQHVRRNLTHRNFAESLEIHVVLFFFEPTWLSLAMAMVSTPPPLRLVMKSYDKLSQKLMQSWRSVDQVHSVINCYQIRPHTYRNSTCIRYTRYSNRQYVPLQGLIQNNGACFLLFIHLDKGLTVYLGLFG